MKRVVLAGLDSIKFSINAATKETYQFIHGRDDFEVVLRNLIDCHTLRKELGLKFKIMVSYIMTSKTEDEMDNLHNRIMPYIDEFVPHSVRTMLPQDPENLSELAPRKHEEYRPQNSCPMVFNRIHVTYDGFLSACCFDFNHDLLLADLKTMPLAEAWNSKNAVWLRNKHISKNLAGIMCHNCTTMEYHSYSSIL